jgi:hypothetical protein
MFEFRALTVNTPEFTRMPTMALKDKAERREYMKNYMRARRANLPARTAEEDIPWCNFCGCTADEVHALVKAPDEAPYRAHICDQCVERAADAVAERQGPWWR